MAHRVVAPTKAARGKLAMLSKLGSVVRHFGQTGGPRFLAGRRRGAVLLVALAALLAAPASATAQAEQGVFIETPELFGLHPGGTASFGQPLTLVNRTNHTLVKAGLDEANPAGPSTSDACTPLTNPNEVAQRIALVDRGTCGFTDKVKNAQDAGAVAVVVADNVAGAPVSGMTGNDPTITIPSVKVTQEVGALIKGQLAIGDVSASVGLFDVRPPVLEVPNAEVVANAIGPAGANVFFEFHVTDDVDPHPQAWCLNLAARTFVQPGDLFPIGSTSLECAANDSSGNATIPPVFQIRVKGAPEQISGLAADIRALNLKQGIANSLDAKLQNLLAALDDVRGGARVAACNKLDAVVNEINAQAGKEITQTQAGTLLTDLARIRAVLAC